MKMQTSWLLIFHSKTFKIIDKININSTQNLTPSFSHFHSFKKKNPKILPFFPNNQDFLEKLKHPKSIFIKILTHPQFSLRMSQNFLSNKSLTKPKHLITHPQSKFKYFIFMGKTKIPNQNITQFFFILLYWC